MDISVIIAQMGKLFLILCLGFALARLELLDLQEYLARIMVHTARQPGLSED